MRFIADERTMCATLEELKYQVHAARVSLAYQESTTRPERDGSRESQIAAARTRLEDAIAALNAAKPEPVSLRVKSPYFIGPRRRAGKRGDGPTIKCFRCEEVKPRKEFYSKGTVCKACTVKRSAEWAGKNPEASRRNKRKYAEENREAHNKQRKAKYWENPEKERQRNRDRYDPAACNEYQKKYLSERRRRDPGFRAFLNCKGRMHRLMKSAGVKKKTRSAELIGLQRDEFLKYLESLWLPGMSWGNYGWGRGKWVIDHIIPAASFDHTIIEQQMKCWHYTNLRPMWFRENLQKSDLMPCGNRARYKKIPLTTFSQERLVSA